MARDRATIAVPQGQFVELTSGDATSVTFFVRGGGVTILVAGATAPTDPDKGVDYPGGTGEMPLTLADMANSGGARLWAYGRQNGNSQVYVDHA